MRRSGRSLTIFAKILRYILVPAVAGQSKRRWLRVCARLNPFARRVPVTERGALICDMLESLGPIFIKFGQQLSLRQDVLPADIVQALTRLQDQVKPFSNESAQQQVEAACEQPIADMFADWSSTPLAAASIAQVHAATLHSGEKVIVKILRPGIRRAVARDIRLMYRMARRLQRKRRFGARLKPVAMVKEFETTILAELDLVQEAANASQLRRNFADSEQLYVPRVYWRYTHPTVMVMERIYGVRISDVAALKAAGTDLKRLAENGVEIFFTQMLRDRFFHADMHPGNLFVDVSKPDKPRYLGVDFGIMGALSDEDQYYLAKNFQAFFNCDYRQVALLHVQSGWVPPDTRVDQFEASIRRVCEPIFQRSLQEISFSQVLLGLIKTAEQFQMQMQPQLMLLQKTLVNIEGLGRQLYPELDLWKTAKPVIDAWLRSRYDWRKGLKQIAQGLPETIDKLSVAPEMVWQVISHVRDTQHKKQYAEDNALPKSPRCRWHSGWTLAIGVIGGAALVAVGQHWPVKTWTTNGVEVACVAVVGWLVGRYLRGSKS